MMTNPREKNALVIGDDSDVRALCDEENRTPDQYDYDDYWDSVYEATGALVRERDDKAYKLHNNLGDWYCEVSNFGWRHQSGSNIFDVPTYQRKNRTIGFDFLNHILPQTDNTFYIYDDFEGFGLKINNAHHDAPAGGEMYYCAPIDWMIAKGYWGGLHNDGDEMIPEIYEALLGEWETEFLNKELSAIKGTPQEASRGYRWWQGSGQRLALDIEFPTLYKKFLAGYGNPTGDYLTEFKEDLRDFFEKYYASSAVDEWTDHVQNSNFNGFGNELGIFIRAGGFQVDERSIPDETYQRLKRIYEKVVA